MPRQTFENDSSATSDSLYDLNLPTIEPGDEPLPLKSPSYELVQAHARFLLRCGVPKGANRSPVPEMFVMD